MSEDNVPAVCRIAPKSETKVRPKLLSGRKLLIYTREDVE